jgi:hypothetical protein
LPATNADAPNSPGVVQFKTCRALSRSRQAQHELSHHPVHQPLRLGAFDDLHAQAAIEQDRLGRGRSGALKMHQVKVTAQVFQGHSSAIPRRALNSSNRLCSMELILGVRLARCMGAGRSRRQLRAAMQYQRGDPTWRAQGQAGPSRDPRRLVLRFPDRQHARPAKPERDQHNAGNQVGGNGTNVYSQLTVAVPC